MNSGRLFGKAGHGTILPVIVPVIILMLVIGIGVLGLGLHSRMLAIRTGTDIAARCAADAAIAEAVFRMNEKIKIKPWDGSSLPAASNVSLPNCDAIFDYAVSEISGNYVVNATGRAGRSVHNIEGVLRIQSAFDYAIFAKDTIELKNKAIVDWYNNQPDDWPMQIGTNSTADSAVIFKNGSTVKSDVFVGVGGIPSDVISGIDQIQGNTYVMFSKVVLPSVTVPDTLAMMASGGDIKNNTTLSSSGKYSGINLGNSKVLDINEPVSLYITEDIILGNNAKIVIGDPCSDPDNDASLTIYLAGNFEGKNGSSINNLTKDAKRFTFYGLDTCADIRLKNGSDFYGTIYAPGASIEMDNSAGTYGSVIGQRFILKNGGTFYYDTNLRDRTVNDDAVRFAIKRWSEQ
jgi:hypothetical protein